MQVNVRADGIHLVDGVTGREVTLDTAVMLVNADGSATVRFAARDVTVIVPIDPNQAYDFTDIARLVIAVVRGVLTIAQIQAVRPAVAVAVQTFMTNNGLTAGQSPQP